MASFGSSSPGKHMDTELCDRVRNVFWNKAHPHQPPGLPNIIACFVFCRIFSLADWLPFWMTKYITYGQQRENIEAS
jgi:hypothetical protein